METLLADSVVSHQGEPTPMQLWHVATTIYFLSEWIVRLIMLVYVPQKRSPAASRTWLLFIFIFPWPGLIMYAFFGRIALPYRRIEMQQEVSRFIQEKAQILQESIGFVRPKVEERFEQTVTMTQNLGDFGTVGGNRFELFSDYQGTINRLTADIDAAQKHVHLLYYIFADDEVGRQVEEALVRAVKRGVECRVLIDDWGSKASLKTLVPRLKSQGVQVQVMLPVSWFRRRAARFDLRNHRKIAVVDSRIGFLGSQNLVNPDFKEGITYEELVVRATGPVVRQLQAVFLTDWYLETDEAHKDFELSSGVEMDGSSPAQVLPSGPGYPRANTHQLMVALIYAARERIVITTPYFIPDEPFLQALETAVLRGVEVHLMVSSKADQILVSLAQQSFYDQLLEAGVQVHLYERNFLHAKHMTIDGAIALIGSSNMDIRSFLLNAEISVLIYDPEVVAKVRALQEQCFRNCSSLTLETWDQRSLLSKVTQNMARLVDAVL